MSLLNSRQHKSIDFFEKVMTALNSNTKQAVDMIIPAYSMTQHSAFTSEEEMAFDKVWAIAKRIRDQS